MSAGLNKAVINYSGPVLDSGDPIIIKYFFLPGKILSKAFDEAELLSVFEAGPLPEKDRLDYL